MTQSGKALIYDMQGPSRMAFRSSYTFSKPVGKKDVLIKTISGGLNPVDYKLPLLMPRGVMGNIVGTDICGTVVAVGKDVNSIAVGDVVFGFGAGLAEYAVCPASNLAKVPEGVPTDVAGGLPVAALTAYQMLDCAGAFRGEDAKRIVVIGASGGTGSCCIQISKALAAPGSHIIAVCSAKNAELVKGWGADEVLDYKVEGFTLGKSIEAKSIDVIADCVSSADDHNYVPEGMPLLKASGKYVAINSGSKRDWIRTMLRAKTGINLFWGRYSMLLCQANSAELSLLANLVKEGKLKLEIQERFKLEEDSIRAAFEKLKSRRTVGKLVVVV